MSRQSPLDRRRWRARNTDLQRLQEARRRLRQALAELRKAEAERQALLADPLGRLEAEATPDPVPHLQAKVARWTERLIQAIQDADERRRPSPVDLMEDLEEALEVTTDPEERRQLLRLLRYWKSRHLAEHE